MKCLECKSATIHAVTLSGKTKKRWEEPEIKCSHWPASDKFKLISVVYGNMNAYGQQTSANGFMVTSSSGVSCCAVDFVVAASFVCESPWRFCVKLTRSRARLHIPWWRIWQPRWHLQHCSVIVWLVGKCLKCCVHVASGLLNGKFHITLSGYESI